MLEIVIASHNLHKIREFREMFKEIKGVDILSLLNFPDYKAPPETGSTFEENALIKARDAGNHLNKCVIADDSGLVVPNLNGAPGVYSKRYASEEATDSENRQKLLKEMDGLKDLERAAYFECCLALYIPNKCEKVVHGHCEGLISREERGRHGFGYDPLFIKNDYDKTFAELDEKVKNRISHRRKALEKLLIIIDTIARI